LQASGDMRRHAHGQGGECLSAPWAADDYQSGVQPQAYVQLLRHLLPRERQRLAQRLDQGQRRLDGAAFGRATGREQIGERLRHNLASMFHRVDIHEQVVIIQPREHHAAVYWTAQMTYRNEALVYPGKRGKVYTIDGMTFFTLNHTDSAIVSLVAVWDYALLL
jgi:hypothetical protein